MAASEQPPGRPGRKLSVDYNLEKEPLHSDRTDLDGTDTLREFAHRSKWDIRHWSWPAVGLMLLVLMLGIVLILELRGVRLFTRWIDQWAGQG